MPRHIEATQSREFNANRNLVQDLDMFHYLRHVENISEVESPSRQPSLPQTESYHGASTPLSEYIAEPWGRNTQGCLGTNLQNNPYYLFGTHEEYKYIECGIMKKGMNTHYDNELKEENTAVRFRNFRNRDVVQQLVASMPDHQTLVEWELHTLEGMRCNDNHQHPMKYWSRDIIKSIQWLMWQPAHTEHLIGTPQHCLNSHMPPIRLYTEMHTVNWQLETQARKDIRELHRANGCSLKAQSRGYTGSLDLHVQRNTCLKYCSRHD